jgi:hypothetical protein
MVQMALFAPGKRYPLPDAITREVIKKTPDDELGYELFQTIAAWFGRGGAHGDLRKPWRVADLFDRLPRGLQLVYTLTNLESLTYNGGISCAITRFADGRADIDRFPTETYEDLRLVGASKKARIYRTAVNLQKQMTAALKRVGESKTEDQPACEKACRARFGQKFDGLDRAYYKLEKAEGMDGLIVQYVRRHPDMVVCDKRRGNRRKCRR